MNWRRWCRETTSKWRVGRASGGNGDVGFGRECTFHYVGFAERDAVPHGQSLKGISTLAQGSHRRWIPWVPAPREPNPEGIVYSVPKRTGFAEHDSWGRWISMPERPLVEFHIRLPEDPSKRTSRSRESRPVPIEVDNPFRIECGWGRKPQVSTCGGYLGLG